VTLSFARLLSGDDQRNGSENHLKTGGNAVEDERQTRLMSAKSVSFGDAQS